MSEQLIVVVNGRAEIEYRRNVALTEKQREYLERIDQQMDQGITLGFEQIDDPDKIQRAQYIAILLIKSILEKQEQRIAATCSYLAERLSDLKQIRAVTRVGGAIGIELVFDQDDNNQVLVEFTPAGNKPENIH